MDLGPVSEPDVAMAGGNRRKSLQRHKSSLQDERAAGYVDESSKDAPGWHTRRGSASENQAGPSTAPPPDIVGLHTDLVSVPVERSLPAAGLGLGPPHPPRDGPGVRRGPPTLSPVQAPSAAPPVRI